MKPSTLRQISLLTAGLLLLAAVPLLGQSSDNESQGKFFLGVTGTDARDYLGKVAEYELAEQGVLPMLNAHGTAITRNFYLDFAAINRGDSRDQFYRVDIDAGRVFSTRFLLNNFLHRLDHDPYSNLDTTQASGALLTYATDMAPAHEYHANVSEIQSRNTVRIPTASWLKLQVDYRRLDRDGSRQGSTMGKCYSCHVISQPRPTDETLNEVKASVLAGTERYGIEYAFLYRENKEATAAVDYLYDPAIHPATLVDMFTNRVLYDNTNGPLPGNTVPTIKKTQHYIKAHYNFNDSTGLLGSVSYAEVENRDTGLSTTSQYYSGRFTTRLPHEITLNARFRYDTIDNDDVYVNLVEMTANAGPQAGRTYSQAYPDFGPADFTRQSALNRDDTQFDADILVPLPQRSRLGFTYEYRRTDREYEESGLTEQQRFTVLFRTDARKPLSANIRYRFETADHPFTNYQAAIEPIIQPYPSPGSTPFAGTQYYTLYESRLANLSNQPTNGHDLDVLGTWKPVANAGVTVHYNYKKQKNDELNYSDWSQTYQMIGGDVYYIPEQRVSLTAGVNYTDYKTETLLTEPVWNG
jgi:hypothetical protein